MFCWPHTCVGVNVRVRGSPPPPPVPGRNHQDEGSSATFWRKVGARWAVQEQGAGATLEKRARGSCGQRCDSSRGQWRRRQLGLLEGSTSILCVALICDPGPGSPPMPMGRGGHGRLGGRLRALLGRQRGPWASGW